MTISSSWYSFRFSGASCGSNDCSEIVHRWPGYVSWVEIPCTRKRNESAERVHVTLEKDCADPGQWFREKAGWRAEETHRYREVRGQAHDVEESCRTLDGFCDQPGPQTTGADADAQGRTVYKCFHALQIGIEDALGLVVCMADVISSLMFLPTEITGKCHGPTPLLQRRSTTSPWIGANATIAPQAMTSRRG